MWSIRYFSTFFCASMCVIYIVLSCCFMLVSSVLFNVLLNLSSYFFISNIFQFRRFLFKKCIFYFSLSLFFFVLILILLFPASFLLADFFPLYGSHDLLFQMWYFLIGCWVLLMLHCWVSDYNFFKEGWILFWCAVSCFGSAWSFWDLFLKSC